MVHNVRAFLLAAAGLFLLLGCSGGTRTFRVREENDVGRFGGGTDRFYTQGLELEYTGPLDEEAPVITDVARTLHLHPQKGEYGFSKQYVGASFGQQMFTPEDITLDPDIPEDKAKLDKDRPYAGWLYGAATLHSLSLAYGVKAEGDVDAFLEKFLSTRDDRLDTLRLEVGVVGPSSLAEDIQTWYHDLIETDEPEGWEEQLKDEPGVNLLYRRNHRMSFGTTEKWGLEYDLLTNFGGSLGNVQTYGQVGGQFRLGQWLRRDFGLGVAEADFKIEALEELQERLDSDQLKPGVRERLAQQLGRRFSWNVFFGVDGRAVLRNIFLDGNTFRTSHEVDKEYFVADFQVGGALQFPGWELRYTQFIRTPEFRRGSDPQIFGSAQFAFRF